MMQTTITCPSGQTIRVEIARTERERARGLSGRPFLEKTICGIMALHFGQGGQANAQALYVLELPWGEAGRLRLRVGDVLRF
jgi:uncharacterized membrane protein (UPF0127 family)